MDANLASLIFQRETTWGVVPGSIDMTRMRFTGESLKHDTKTVTSKEIRPDRQTAAIIKVGAEAGGDINFELNCLDYVHLFEAMLMNAKSVVAITGLTCSLTATTQIVAAVATSFDNVLPGCSILISGAATSANNGIKQVVAKAGDGSTITLAAGSITADEASPSLNISGTHLKNGITEFSYTMERKLPAVGGGYKYQRFYGMQPDTLELNFESGAIVTAKAGFMGRIGDTNDTSLDGTPTEPSSADPVNASNNVGTIMRGGAAMTEKFKKLTLNLKNNLRGRDCVGTEGNFDLGVGSVDVTGQMDSYFKDNALLQAVINNDDTSLSYRITDPAGNVLVINLPKLKLTTATSNATAQNTDVMVPLDLVVYLHPTYLATILVSFIPAA